MLRCPSCSAPIEGQGEQCAYCGARLAGYEKHAEVEWPLRSPDAEALVALELRCPRDRPLDPVRGLLEDAFVAAVVELGPRGSLRRVEQALRDRIPARLEAGYRLEDLRLTAYTPLWDGTRRTERRPLRARRRRPTSRPAEEPVEELVAPSDETSARLRSFSAEHTTRVMKGAGLALGLALVVAALFSLGMWISRHLFATVLGILAVGAVAAIAWAVQRDRARKARWRAHRARKRAASASGRVEEAPSPPAPPAPEAASAPEAPEPSPAAPEAEGPPEEPSTDSSVSLRAPGAPARRRERG